MMTNKFVYFIFVLGFTVNGVNSECDADGSKTCFEENYADAASKTPDELCGMYNTIVAMIKTCAAKVSDCGATVKKEYEDTAREALANITKVQELCGCEGKTFEWFEGIKAKFDQCEISLSGANPDDYCSTIQMGLDCYHMAQEGCKAPVIEQSIQSQVLAKLTSYFEKCDLMFRGEELKIINASTCVTADVRLLQCYSMLEPVFGDDYTDQKLLLGIDTYCSKAAANKSIIQESIACFEDVDLLCPDFGTAFPDLEPAKQIEKLNAFNILCALVCPSRQTYFTSALACQAEIEKKYMFDDYFDATVSAKNSAFCTASKTYVECITDTLKTCKDHIETYVDLAGAAGDRNYIRESMKACTLTLSKGNSLVWWQAMVMVVSSWVVLF